MQRVTAAYRASRDRHSLQPATRLWVGHAVAAAMEDGQGRLSDCSQIVRGWLQLAIHSAHGKHQCVATVGLHTVTGIKPAASGQHCQPAALSPANGPPSLKAGAPHVTGSGQAARRGAHASVVVPAGTKEHLSLGTAGVGASAVHARHNRGERAEDAPSSSQRGAQVGHGHWPMRAAATHIWKSGCSRSRLLRIACAQWATFFTDVPVTSQ